MITQPEKWTRLSNLIANLSHPDGDHLASALEDEASDLIRELRRPDPDACPQCGERLEYDEVDIEVGVQRGNPGCPACHWVPGVSIHARVLNEIAARVHVANAKWWVDLETGQPKSRNVGELLMLCVSELAEALEGHRKNLQDDKLPHRKMFEVELADCFIRLADIAAGLKLDIGGAFEEKMKFNSVRPDHQLENRRQADGKKY